MVDDSKLVERRVLGYGLAARRADNHDPTRADVVFERDPGTGRRGLPLVAGAEALAHDLEAAFATSRGTDLLNRDFGFDGLRAIAEEEDRAVLRERIRAAAAAVLMRDARVRRVLEITVGPNPATKENRATHAVVDCMFETILGGRQRVTFGSTK